MSDSQQPNLQRLLELHYDLLPDDEAVELRAEIERDAELSRAFDNARRTADLFALAAKLEEPRLSFGTTALDRDGQASPSHVIVNATSAIPGSADDGALRFRRAMQWVVGLAAAVLLAFLVGAYAHHRGRLSNIAAEHLRMTVTGPSELARGVENRFEVKTTDITGRPASVPVRYSLLGLAGEKILTEELTTDVNGVLMFTCPASTPLPPAARLEVVAITDNHTWSAETALPVELPRLATRLATDKPLYRPGEVVRYRSLTLGRFGLDTPGDVAVHFHVLDPAGAVIDGSQIDGITTRGVGNGEFAITPDRPGGEYQLVATCPSNAFPEEKRKFFVRDYRVPRLKKDLEFVRDSYAAGDKVAADLSVIRAEGGPAASAKVTVTAQVDGATVHQQELSASASGACRVEFDLPKAIERGDGLLSIVVDDGGTQETIAKTIPLNVGKVDIKFYPEGGDLVAGLENRVYFVARNPQGKPQHIVGKVCDTNEQTVVTFETEHDGMGSFEFTPKEQVQYAVKLTKPADVTLTGELPAVNAERQFVLSTGDGVFAADKPIDLTLQAKKADAPLVVAAYCRGVQVGQASVTTKQGANDVTVPLNAEACGVVRVTVYDYTQQAAGAADKAGKPDAGAKPDTENTAPRPIAERLVYRKLDRRLQVSLANHREHYAPGDKVDLSIMCTNESGKPVKSSVLGVAVVDDSLLKLADDDTASLTTHVLLTTEIEKPEDLEKADFYLSDDPKADAALDLLLGTQGWRRFVERTVEEQRKEAEKAGTPAEPQEPVKRLLALSGTATPPAMLDNLDEVRRQYNAAVTDAEDDQRAALGMLRRIGIGGGLVLVLVILALELAPLVRRQPVGEWWRAGLRAAPALATAGACLAIAALVFRAGDAPQSSLASIQQIRIEPPTREQIIALAESHR